MNGTMKKINYKKYVNIDELIFDCSIIMLFLIINYFIIDDAPLVESINNVLLFLLLLITVFLSPIYLSSINSRFYKFRKNSLNKIISPISLLVTLSTSILIVYVMPYYLTEYYKSGIFYSFFLINLFFGIIALIIGWHIGSKYEIERDDPTRISIGIFTYLAPLLVIMPIIVTAFIYEFSLNFPFSLLAGIIALIFSFNFLKTGNEIIEKIFRSLIFHDYIFPFFMASILTFTHEVFSEIIFIKNKNSTTLVFLQSLIISGILPTRVILLLSPPRKIFNVLIGLCPLTLLFLNLFSKF